MAEWSNWFDEVLPEVPGCPQPVAINAIRNATIAFCYDSRVLLLNHPLMDAVANQATYPWMPDGNQVAESTDPIWATHPWAPGYSQTAQLKVVRAEQVWFEGRELFPTTSDDLEERFVCWPQEVGTPQFFLQDQIAALRIVPRPQASAASAIRARVSVTPSRASLGVTDMVRERYLEPIAMGAKARLMLMQRKPWSNPQMGAALMVQFEDEIAKARLAAFKGWVRSRNNSNRGYRRFV
jgi:hypothetical protein